MKIGFDAKRLYNNFTGLGSYSRSLVYNLCKYFPGNNFYLYTPKVKLTPETELFFNNPAYATVLPDTRFNPLWRSLYLSRQLEKDGLDLFHGLSHEIPFSIHKSSVKSIVTIHDLIFKIYPKTYSLIDRSIYDYKFKYSCRNSDKIIAISESTKKDIVNQYKIHPDKIEVIYQSCNPLFYNLNKDNNHQQVLQGYKIPREYLLYVGSVIQRKNLIGIIKSYEHLPKDLQIPLVVIGNGRHYKTEVQKLIKKKKLEHLIIWVNNLKSNSHLQIIYQNSQALIYPSLYEGFGIPIVEALLSKTPVITSNLSSLPEAGGADSYYLDNPENAAEMALGIEAVLTDSVRRERMKEEGWLYAMNQFDPEKLSERIYDLYKKILR